MAKQSSAPAPRPAPRTPAIRVLPIPLTQAAAARPSPVASATVLPATRSETKAARARKAIQLPPILLEGDTPPPPLDSGPGERYALAPTPPTPEVPSALAQTVPREIEPTPVPVRAVEAITDLPEAYGTERLFLAARDPHWLYAAWDLTSEQRNKYNVLSQEGHLVLRTYQHEMTGTAESQTHVHADSKSWFIPVKYAGSCYRAELGYYAPGGRWHQIAISDATLTPPEKPFVEELVQFATIPPDVTLKELFQVVQEAVCEDIPLLEAVQQLRAEGFRALPEVIPAAASRPWTRKQQAALASLVRLDESRRVWMGSLEITELIRRHLQEEITSAAPPGGPMPAEAPAGPSAIIGISSPLALAPEAHVAEKPFWLTINAELVLYGATEADATVSVGGRKIRLRPDGTFSYRFALPDGQYPLKLTATSADGQRGRAVQLQFGRSTQVHGQVGVHDQDRHLKPPLEANFE